MLSRHIHFWLVRLGICAKSNPDIVAQTLPITRRDVPEHGVGLAHVFCYSSLLMAALIVVPLGSVRLLKLSATLPLRSIRYL